YRNPQVRGRQLQLFGDELPGEADRVALEVIAKGKVSEHLEEGVMPRGVADLLEVIVLATRSDALLHRGRASSTRRLLLPEKYSLELHHARVGKHQRRVVRRHHRRARVDDVPVLFEVLGESLADFGGVHGRKYTRAVAVTSLYVVGEDVVGGSSRLHRRAGLELVRANSKGRRKESAVPAR